MSECSCGQFSKIAKKHAMSPCHHGQLKKFNGYATITGPCGDTMFFWVEIEKNKIKEISFDTDGCHSSLACGSMATVKAKGQRLDVVMALSQKSILDAFLRFPEESKHCALLAVNTLKAACENALPDTEKKT